MNKTKTIKSLSHLSAYTILTILRKSIHLTQSNNQITVNEICINLLKNIFYFFSSNFTFSHIYSIIDNRQNHQHEYLNIGMRKSLDTQLNKAEIEDKLFSNDRRLNKLIALNGRGQLSNLTRTYILITLLDNCPANA